MAQTRSEIQARYDAKNTKMYSVKLNLKIDSDIVEKLSNVDSIQGYIKGLIREDIARTRFDSVPVSISNSVPKLEKGEIKMLSKFDIIKNLTEDGIFDLTQEILDIIDADQNDSHKNVNKEIRSLINSINQMSNVLYFNFKNMIDLATQAYGFEKFIAYSEVASCADISEQLDELHRILWIKYNRFMTENDSAPDSIST